MNFRFQNREANKPVHRQCKHREQSSKSKSIVHEMVNEVASMTMSLKDKLAFIDHEIRTLHKFCIDKGYTPQQIEEKASPVLKPVTALTDKLKRARSKRRGLTLTLLKCAVIVAVASAIVYCDPAYRFVCAYSRLGVLQVLTEAA